MRKIRIIEHISLDGVIQAPGGPNEDGDYPHGGWGAVPHHDPAVGEAIVAGHGKAFDLLLGRRTSPSTTRRREPTSVTPEKEIYCARKSTKLVSRMGREGQQGSRRNTQHIFSSCVECLGMTLRTVPSPFKTSYRSRNDSVIWGPTSWLTSCQRLLTTPTKIFDGATQMSRAR
jgi:hypothetical protein